MHSAPPKRESAGSYALVFRERDYFAALPWPLATGESERKNVRFDGQTAIGLGVVKQSKANTLEVADAIKAEVAEIAKELDPNLTFEGAFDSRM